MVSLMAGPLKSDSSGRRGPNYLAVTSGTKRWAGDSNHDFDLVGHVVGRNTLNCAEIIGWILGSPTLMMHPAWCPHSLYLYSEIK
jgi:hypothetical protein